MQVTLSKISLILVLMLTATMTCDAAGQRRKLDPIVAEFIEAIDAKSGDISTMQGDFTQRKEISLLKDPVVMNGRFYIKKEIGIRFEFQEENDLSLTLRGDTIVALHPQEQKASLIKVKRRQANILEKLLNVKQVLSRTQRPRNSS